MAGRHGLWVLGSCIVVALLTGCTGATSSPIVSPAAVNTASANASTAPAAMATPTTAPIPLVPPSPSAVTSASLSPEPIDALAPGTTIETVVDRVRIRSLPGVGSESQRFAPLLPTGTPLVVIGGPVRADGYDWYEIVPLTGNAHPKGWVAQSGRDGETWAMAATFDCPALPTDLASLTALHDGVGLACFAGRAITVRARLMDCNCDPTPGGWFDPGWFNAYGNALMVDPSSDRPPADHTAWFELYLDPTGRHLDPLPIAKSIDGVRWASAPVVRVTGVFDHPDAARCTFAESDGPSAATGRCRTLFAATAIEAVE